MYGYSYNTLIEIEKAPLLFYSRTSSALDMSNQRTTTTTKETMSTRLVSIFPQLGKEYLDKKLAGIDDSKLEVMGSVLDDLLIEDVVLAKKKTPTKKGKK